MFLLLFIICCLSFIEYTMREIRFNVSTSMIVLGTHKQLEQTILIDDYVVFQIV